MERFVCVHGHFYQPPRENPWLEAVELQESAYPHHDWNERITFECYAPNAAARILDGRRRIESIVNNYASMSFNFGPTLLSWMEDNAPAAYRSILEADRESVSRFSGHGSAMAQVYNHMILPLANDRDRRTQVRWGVRDFIHRFGRPPEGMWLPETAADTGSLELLAEEGIRFTVLAPRQALRTRRRSGGSWKDVRGEGIDPTRPYHVRLPSGRSLAVFFYDGPISQAIAFEGLLGDGRRLARRLLDGFSDKMDRSQLIHVATDGESYGHHHRHGEMALSYALRWVQEQGGAKLTNYGEFLDLFPPTHRAEIVEKSSWSCVHGIDRWWSDCGCAQRRDRSWNQAWRTPLRDAFDWLRDTVAPLFEDQAGRLLHDPWAARDDYIDVVLDRSPGQLQRFWAAHARRPLERHEQVRALKLLELQRHAMLMYTSCGWFFDDVSGIEAVQVMRYAGRVVHLAGETLDGGAELEAGLVERLGQARSNLPDQGDGARIYRRHVAPGVVDLKKVGAHYAISSLFESYGDEDEIYCYAIRRTDVQEREAGQQRLLLGRIDVESRITGESASLCYGVFHMGDHNLQAGVHEFRGEEDLETLVRESFQAFDGGDVPQVIRILDRHFGGVTYSLRSLFHDRQREITESLLARTLEEAEDRFRDIYEQHAPLMRFLGEARIPLPAVLHAVAQFVLNGSLRRILETDPPDLDRFRALMEAARAEGVELDASGLGYALGRALKRMMSALKADPSNMELLKFLLRVARVARSLPFEVDLWSAQNTFYRILKRTYPEMRSRSDQEARTWVSLFAELGEAFTVQVNGPEPAPGS